jgi:hypothetical protein
MKAGFEVAGRWKIIDGPDLITIWLGCDGFHSQRISNFNSDNAIGHEPQKINLEDLILAAEGQRKLII